MRPRRYLFAYAAALFGIGAWIVPRGELSHVIASCGVVAAVCYFVAHARAARRKAGES